MDEKRGRGRPKKIVPGTDFLFDSPDNPEMDDIGLEQDVPEQPEEPNLDPKQWRSVMNKQKSVQSDPRVGEDLRLNLALQKFRPEVVWALQGYAIMKNPEMLYRCTHTIKDTDTRSSIIKKATTFLNNSDVQLIIEWSKKNFLEKESFIPAEMKKWLLEKKEDDYVNGIINDEGEAPELTPEEIRVLLSRAIKLNKNDPDVQMIKTYLQAMPEDKKDEVDMFSSLCHFAFHRDCEGCEFKLNKRCIGCFRERLEYNECTDEELTWYENYMKDD